MSFPRLPSLSQYVRKKLNKDTRAIQEAAGNWLKVFSANHLSYEIEWLGIPIIQSPEDMLLMQELIFKLRPDVLIETGVAHGGSLIYYSSLFELLGNGRVIGIDIEIRAHNRAVLEQHPMMKRITLVEGSSVSEETLAKVRSLIGSAKNILVCLDSDHTAPHVLKELELYSSFVPVGGYLVVFDTFTEFVAAAGSTDAKYINNGPRTAVEAFLKKNSNFEVDVNYDRLWISASPGGYLKRIR